MNISDMYSPADEVIVEKATVEAKIEPPVADEIEPSPTPHDDIVDNVIVEDVIEVVSGEIVDSEDNYPEEAEFKTAQVAKFLNINPQTVRNYEATFADVLHIRKGECDNPAYAPSIWTKKDVKELRRILELKKANGWTNAELVKRLTEPATALYNASTDSKAMENLLAMLQECVDKSLSSTKESIIDELKGYISQTEKLLADNHNDEQLLKLSQEQAGIAKTQEEIVKANTELTEMVSSLTAKVNKQEDGIEELIKQNELLKQQNELLLEQTKKKKRFLIF